MHPGWVIRFVLFEDVWDIALHLPPGIRALNRELTAKIEAAPSDRQATRARREVACTPEDARELLRALTEAAAVHARFKNDPQFLLSVMGCNQVINAMKVALEVRMVPAPDGTAAARWSRRSTRRHDFRE